MSIVCLELGAAPLLLVDKGDFVLESLLQTLEASETLFARFLELATLENKVATAANIKVLDGWKVELAYGAYISIFRFFIELL